MKGLLLATAFAAGVGLAGIVNAQENWERTRLTKQPDVGNITENIKANKYIRSCGNESYIRFQTSTGYLYFKADKKERPYVELKEDGTPKQNPWVFLDDKVYVNVNGDTTFDFSQSQDVQGQPCSVLTSLAKYDIK